MRLVGQTGGRELHREPLELGADPERLRELVTAGPAYPDAPVRRKRDEPFGGEQPERLADRRPAHAELLGEPALAQHGFGRNRAGGDGLLDSQRDLVGLRRAGHRHSVSAEVTRR